MNYGVSSDNGCDRIWISNLFELYCILNFKLISSNFTTVYMTDGEASDDSHAGRDVTRYGELESECRSRQTEAVSLNILTATCRHVNVLETLGHRQLQRCSSL